LIIGRAANNSSNFPGQGRGIYGKGQRVIRLAIVGVGGYGYNILRLIDALGAPHCRIVAAADFRLAAFGDRCQELRRRGVRLYEDAAAMFRQLRGQCEAVYIATSIPSHAPLLSAAAQAGLHVLLEKPPAATVQEVDAMCQAVEKAGILCQVGFQMMHAESIRRIAQAIEHGHLGAVRSAVCCALWPRDEAYYARNDWAGKLRTSDGPWVLDGPATNALSHHIASLLYFCGAGGDRLAEPAAVRAELYAAGPVESHNIAAIEIQTPAGARAVFLAAHCTKERFDPVITLHADGGRACWIMNDGAHITRADGTIDTCPHGHQGASLEMLRNFLQAIETGDAALLRCPLAKTRPVVAALNGAHESSGCVRRVEDSRVRWVGEAGKRHVVVDGLDEMLHSAAEGGCLLSDLPDAPRWVQPTEPFDLRGYDRFPQRFSG